MHGGHGLRRSDRPGGGESPGTAEAALLLRVFCHEFRTPVSTLTSLTRALADDRSALGEADRRTLTRLARDQAVHLEGLLRDVVAGAGALAGAGGTDTARLAEVVAGAARLVPAERCRTHVTRPAAASPVPAGRTRQVLANLVENALRHGPPDGEIGLYAALRARGLSILVTDEGRVDAALLQALRCPNPGSEMSGLGLWIVRRLVALDGGRVRVHRRRSRGVALEVLLPYRRRSG